MNAVYKLAQTYHYFGYHLVVVGFKDKKPKYPGWPDLRYEPEDLIHHFGQGPVNIGVALGEPSDGLVDIDLDCPEAIALAPDFLPETGAVFGRNSAPLSHYLYRVSVKTQKFSDPEKPRSSNTLAEIRSTGAQTVFPGSVHKSGEPIRWERNGAPRELKGEVLQQRVSRLCAACLCARYWPGEGGRHDAQLTVGACLVRADFSDEDGASFIASVTRVAGGAPEYEKRLSTMRDCRKRADERGALRGYTALTEVFGKKVAERIAKWLGLPKGRAAGAGRRSVSKSEQCEDALGHGSDVAIARAVIGVLKRENENIVSSEGAVFVYAKSHWQRLDDLMLRRAVLAFDGLTYTVASRTSVVSLNKGRIDSIINVVHTLLYVPKFFIQKDIGINCVNGFLKFGKDGTFELLPHDSNRRIRHVVSAAFEGPACSDVMRSSLLMKLLGGCFKGDVDADEKIALLAEIAAAAVMGIATRLPQPMAFVLYGSAANNGKSQVLKVLRGLLPADVVSSVPMDNFGDEKWLVRLVGSLLNTADELSGARQITSSRSKQIITGEPIMARDLYRPAFVFSPVAQHVFATNVLPSFQDGFDQGIRRRYSGIEFGRVIPKEERVANIADRIIASELELLLAWVVDGASRLVRNRAFTEPSTSKDLMRVWFFNSDPILAWLEEEVVVDPQAPFVSTGDAYQSFRFWAQREGFSVRQIPERNIFAQRILSAEPKIKKHRDGRTRGFVGMILPVHVEEPSRHLTY